MSQSAGLQAINSLVSTLGLQNETKVLNPEASHEAFPTILNVIKSDPKTDAPAEATSLPPAAAIKGEEARRVKGIDFTEGNEEDLALLLFGPGLTLPAVAGMEIQPGIVLEGSSTLSPVAIEKTVPPEQKVRAQIQAALNQEEVFLGIDPQGENPISVGDLGGVKGLPVQTPLNHAPEEIGKVKDRFPVTIGSESQKPSLEKMLQQMTGENLAPVAPNGVAENEASSGDARFHILDPAGERQEENAFLFLSRSGRKGSDDAEAKSGSERSSETILFSNEIIKAPEEVGSSGLPPESRTDHIGSADSIQSKGETRPVSLPGVFDERHLVDQIADKWVASRMKSDHSFRIQLEPERLGTLQIDISVDGERIVAEIVTKHPFVKELLEGNQEILRGALAEQGLKVDRFSVNVGDPGQSPLGWEHHLKERAPNRFNGPLDRSFHTGSERKEVSLQRMRTRDGTWGAINLYV